MENATDALKMAGSVLLFVMALSICVVAFSQVRETIDVVLSFSDREALTIENDDRFYYLSDDNDTNRYVGKETIIPTIYRAYKENYKIVFKFPDNYFLFKKNVTNKNEAGKIISVETKEIKKIDLKEQNISNDSESKIFLDGIIYGNFDTFDATNSVEAKKKFQDHFAVILNDTCLFDYLTSKESSYNIKELLGTYYVNDVGGTKENVDEVNKTTKRVITYAFN